MIEVTDVRWFSGGTGTVGFVMTYDELLKTYCCYTGCCYPDSEDADIENIKNWGAKVDKVIAQAIFPYANLDNYKVF